MTDEKIDIGKELSPQEEAELKKVHEEYEDQIKQQVALDDKKREQIKELYSSIEDPYLASWKIGEGKGNPAEYLNEALVSLNSSKLEQLKQIHDQAKIELVDIEKDEAVEVILNNLDLSLLSNEQREHPRVVKYFGKQSDLLNRLDDLLKR